jgi:adenylate cyclase class IV
MVDRTRVHLDEVEGLRTFAELEVVLDAGEPTESGVVEARRLMAALGIQEDQLVSRAYIDLLQSRKVLGTISSGSASRTASDARGEPANR